MGIFNSKLTAPSGQQKLNKFDLSCDTITSNDFFQFKPVYIREMVAGSSFNVKMSQFTRLAPLVKPMYGSCKFVNRAFFVPMKSIFPEFEAFISQTVPDTSNSIISQVPTFSAKQMVHTLKYNSDLVQVFTDDPQHSSNVKAYDFVIYDSVDSKFKTYKLSRLGQRMYDTLINLGYRLNFVGYQGDSRRFSALPIMALYRIHYDYYRLSQYSQHNYLADIRPDNNVGNDDAFIEIMKVICELPYQRDFFTSSWSNPSGPSSSAVRPAINLPDVTLPNLSTSQKSGITNSGEPLAGTPVVRRDDGNPSVTNFTQYLDSALHHATDFIKRYNLFGSRTKDIYKSLFGIDLSDVDLNRSVHIGKSETFVNIADVMQTTPTETSVLGEYAGKGIGSGNGTFSYKTEKYGYLIIVSVLVPKISYNQGIDRMVKHISPLQFFTGDFDKLGVQAISKDELYGEDGTRYTFDDQTIFDEVFGFTSRYAEYKQSDTYDRLSGVFSLNSLNFFRDFDTYHLSRYIDPNDLGSVNKAFCTAAPAQFDRIFADQESASDHFLTVYHFDVEAWQPMSKMYDDYEWSECDHPKTTTQQVGGTMLE